jgi:hypothetical protein
MNKNLLILGAMVKETQIVFGLFVQSIGTNVSDKW